MKYPTKSQVNLGLRALSLLSLACVTAAAAMSFSVDNNLRAVPSNEVLGFDTIVQPNLETKEGDLPEPIQKLVNDFVKIKGGTFMMGCTSEQGDECYENEHPVHEVYVSDFEMSKFEVTQAQWRALVDEDLKFYSDCAKCPLTNITRFDAEEFIFRLNRMTGNNYRLPTEAEWEYAARGGEDYKYAGSDTLDLVGWYRDNSGERPQPVGQKRPNGYGLYDMSGNVVELCKDRFDPNYYSKSGRDNPQGPSTGSARIFRGGSYSAPPFGNRVSYRVVVPQGRFLDLGFRLVRGRGKAASTSLEERTAEEIASKMIHVEGGTFMMGCTPEQGPECFENESPAHEVTVSDFKIGRYEITQKQWKAIMGYAPDNLFNKDCDHCPVEGVDYYDAGLFIRRLNGITDGNYRLPSEAEWEYAARGGQKWQGFRYSGRNQLEKIAWYSGNVEEENSFGERGSTHPVGTKMPNELGLYDMTGNVWEWCSGWYDGYPGSEGIIDSTIHLGGERVFRGGGYGSIPLRCRVSCRRHSFAGYDASYLGFRLAQ